MATYVRFEKYFSRKDCGLKQDAVYPRLVRMGYQFLKTLVIRFFFDKIDVFGVHQQDGDSLVFAEIGRVFFLDVGEVFGGDVLFERTVALGDLGEKPLGTGVEVEDHVRFGQEIGDGVENVFEEGKLVLGEVVLGEEQALVDEIVADDEIGEEVARDQQLLELLVAVHQESHLHGERIMLGIFVELFQERIVGETLQHQFGVEILGKHRGEGRLAGPYAAFHHDVVIGYLHDCQLS